MLHLKQGFNFNKPGNYSTPLFVLNKYLFHFQVTWSQITTILMAISEHILSKLSNLADTHEFQVLYACETGKQSK